MIRARPDHQSVTELPNPDPDKGWTAVEYVCVRCLGSRMATDRDRPPHCPRCGIRMLADDLSIPPPRAPHRAVG
jgi:DNA-directed RNA polymerase subunit RPC12/RpoP